MGSRRFGFGFLRNEPEVVEKPKNKHFTVSITEEDLQQHKLDEIRRKVEETFGVNMLWSRLTVKTELIFLEEDFNFHEE